MDTLKSFDEILEPDPRQKAFVLFNRETGEQRERSIRDHYDLTSEIILDPQVPEQIREHFETARNLLLYSWFAYRFNQVAELHAYASLEFALKIRSGEEKGGLKHLLKMAIREKWILDSGFIYQNKIKERISDLYEGSNRNIEQISDDPDAQDLQEYCKILVESIPYLRNELAHGSSMVYPGGLNTLAICADIINQLFNSP
ncbi:MAG: hypothetical protein AB1499_17705 [Nitrospirota bacterium]